MARTPKPATRNAKPAGQRGEDASGYPALGRAFGIVERPGAGRVVVIGLAFICAALFLADFVYYKKTYVDIEKVFGFYALYGLAVGLVAVVVAKAMRAVLKRPDDYYAPHTTEVEAYPEDGLDREAQDG